MVEEERLLWSGYSNGEQWPSETGAEALKMVGNLGLDSARYFDLVNIPNIDKIFIGESSVTWCVVPWQLSCVGKIAPTPDESPLEALTHRGVGSRAIRNEF